MTEALERFVGTWTMDAGLPQGPGGRVSFEWMTGGRFLIERWTVDHPEAPDGIALIGPNPGSVGYLQHYFDERGVARVYKMSLEGDVWTLWRDAPDFSPLDFEQRYIGTFDASGDTIEGAWEIKHPGGEWERDFRLIYRRV